MCAIWTPVNVVQGGGVALHDAYTLPIHRIPHAQGPILTATDDGATIGREGKIVHCGSMSTQHYPVVALLDIPKQGSFVNRATGHGSSISTPRHPDHLVCMSRESLAHTSAGYVPQFYCVIPASTCQSASVGCKGQPHYPVGVLPEGLYTGGWLCLLDLPQPNTTIKATSGEQVSIRTPGDRIDISRLLQGLQVRAAVSVPDLNGCASPAAGEHTAIGAKGETDDICMLTHPEQRAIVQVPELDRPIPTSSGQCPSVRAESEGRHDVDMGLPNQV